MVIALNFGEYSCNNPIIQHVPTDPVVMSLNKHQMASCCPEYPSLFSHMFNRHNVFKNNTFL